MKRKALILLAALVGVSFMSCNDDDDNNSVPAEVLNTFTKKYPAATKVEWKDKKGYKVADFYQNNMDTEAWFDANGVWLMTETDIPYSALPQKVKDAFEASKFSTWRIDDVDMLERKDTETVYIIEVEQQKIEIDLFYTAEGILAKVIEDNNSNDYEGKLPQPTPSAIETFIKEKYPQARIVEVEKEKGNIEVDIIHDGKAKEVVFDDKYSWLYTSWDVRVVDLPQAVVDAVKKSQYPDYIIDEADFVETPQASYFLLELEKGNSEVKIKVDENGNIL